MRWSSSFAALLATALPVGATGVGFTFDAGPITFIEVIVDEELDILQDFILGEHMLVTFEMLDTVPDLDPLPGRGEFEDPSGTITLTGATSGTMIDMLPGVNVQFDSAGEFDLRNIVTGPTFHEFELFDDIDFEATGAFLSDPEDLAGSIAELSALLNGDSVFTVANTALSSTAQVGSLDSLGEFVALEFGPVPSVAPVPLPATGAMLVAGFGAMAAVRRRKSRR